MNAVTQTAAETPALSGAEVVLRALKDQGVEVIFGYPGGAVLPIYDALFQQNHIRHILVRHEQAAVHAAEGYARSTGKVGVVLVSYPGAPDFPVKRGALGKPVPGVRVVVQDAQGAECPPGVVGEMKVWRRDGWVPTRDLGRTDEDGYFYHAGRADDVIISAGWTMSAVEIEDSILQHPRVLEAAAIGVPDELRGQVVKAFVVVRGAGDDALAREIQELVRTRLSQHEYPRQLAFVAELPKTPAGKINRKLLREREAGGP